VSDAVPDASDVYEDESIAIVERDDMSSEEDNTDAETDKMPGSADFNSESSDSNDGTGEVPYLDANEPLSTEVSNEHETHHEVEESAYTNPILMALCYCLLFFQLKFRIADCGISFLLAFMKGFLSAIVSLVPSSKPISDLYRMLPLSLCALREMMVSNSKRGITEYVMCPKCSALYQLKDCTTAVPEFGVGTVDH